MRFIIGLCLLLSSCTQEKLSVFTEVVDYTELASFHIDTPDPELLCPNYGQRLHISWFVPGFNETTEIRARIRYANLSEVEWVIPVTTLRGREAWCLLNEAFDETGGILTYKIDLFQDGLLVEETRHALWTELILF